MKKVSRKLTLNKQTMALLDEKEMMAVKGGEGDDKVDATKSRFSCWTLAAACSQVSCKYLICL